MRLNDGCRVGDFVFWVRSGEELNGHVLDEGSVGRPAGTGSEGRDEQTDVRVDVASRYLVRVLVPRT